MLTTERMINFYEDRMREYIKITCINNIPTDKEYGEYLRDKESLVYWKQFDEDLENKKKEEKQFPDCDDYMKIKLIDEIRGKKEED